MAEDGRVLIPTLLDLKKLAQSLVEAEKKLKDADREFIKQAQKTGKKIAAAFAAIGGAALKFGGDFEQSFAEASTLFGDVAVDTEHLKDRILEISDASGISARALTAGLYQSLSAGIPITEDAAEVTNFLEKSALLAKAGLTDLETAVGATTKILNAYGLGVEHVDRIQGILVQTQNSGITTVGELGTVIANVTVTAANLGVTFEEVGAALALMTKSGITTGAATTALNAMLSEMSTAGSKADIAIRRASLGLKLFSKEEINAAKADFRERERALSSSLSKQLRERQKTLTKERALVKKNLDEEIRLLRDNTAEEIKLATDAFNKKKELINQEFIERLKIIDEERFNKLKAIDDEIKGINKLTEDEEKAIQQKEDNEKMAELSRRVEMAKTDEERQKAIQELSDFQADLNRRILLEQREQLINNLEEQKNGINEEFDARVDALKKETEAKNAANEKEFESNKEVIAKTFEAQKMALDELHAAKLEEFDEARDAEIERIQEANAARIAAVQAANEEIIKSYTDVTGSKGFQELLDEGHSVGDVLKMLKEQADASGVGFKSFFSSIEAQRSALVLSKDDAKLFEEELKKMQDTQGLVEEGAEKVSDTFNTKFNTFLERGKNILIELFEKMEPVVNALFDFAEAAFEGEAGALAIVSILGGLVTILGIYKISQIASTAALTLWEAGSVLATATTGALGAAFTFLTSPIGLVVIAVGALIAVAAFLLLNWEKTKKVFGDIVTAIKDKIVFELTDMAEFMGRAWDNIKEFTEKAFNKLKEFFGFIFGQIVTDIKAQIDAVKGVFENIIGFIENVFTGNWKGAFENVVGIFKSIFGGLPGFVKVPLNALIDLVNGLFSGIGEIKIPDWVPGIGGESFSIPVIPKLQRGGLAFGKTLAMVGDNPGALTNPEVIAPLDQLQNMMFNMSGGMGPGRPIMLDLNAVLEVDGEKLAEVNLKAQDDIITFL